MIYFISLRKILNLAICCYNILVMEFLGCYRTTLFSRAPAGHRCSAFSGKSLLDPDGVAGVDGLSFLSF
jgi:hypothetical protein